MPTLTPETLSYEEPGLALARGNAQWAIAWRRFARQQSQPKWLKLCVAAFGSSSLHSSQITAWSNGTLREPAPKLLLVVGQLNLGLAYSTSTNEAERAALKARGAQPLPDSHRSTWQYLEPIRQQPSGLVLGPDEVFQALTGRLDLGLTESRHIPTSDEHRVATSLGRYLRLKLASQGIDWLSEIPRLRTTSPVIEPLLMGQPVLGDDLVADLPTLSNATAIPIDDLWDVCATTIATPAP